MLDGMFVFNAVSHAYNLTDENTQPARNAQALRDIFCVMHKAWQPKFGVNASQMMTDWPIEILARTLFLESDCDMAATHTLTLQSYFKGSS
jgi:hypothetical protein